MPKYFKYGNTETEYLSKRCPRMKQLIAFVGNYQREVDRNIFRALCNSIIAQQISVKAANTVIKKFENLVKEVTPVNVSKRRKLTIQKCGMTMKKAEYIRAMAKRVISGEIDFLEIAKLSNDEIISTLIQIKGVGIWTVEMLLIFSLERKNVLSFGDLVIRNSIAKLHHHETLSMQQFETYRELYSPYCSTASLFLWAMNDLKDDFLLGL